MSQTLIVFTALFLTSLVVHAQQPVSSPEDKATTFKVLSGGVVNGKARTLPKPNFPPAARAVGATGVVTVQVLIDENGSVISATAISGHPLLRAAAVEAARGAKFSPTQLEGIPVKVSGVITYNFVGAMTASKLGFMISFAERSGNFIGHTPPSSLASELPADWAEEKEILASLTFAERVIEKKPEPPPVKMEEPAAKAEQPTNVEQKEPDTNRYTMVLRAVSVASPSTEKLDSKSVAAVAKLRSMVQGRMAADPRAAWNYELGTELGALLAESDDPSKLQAHADTIGSLIARAPEPTREPAMQNLKEFVDSVKAGKAPDDLRARVEQLSNFKY